MSKYGDFLKTQGATDEDVKLLDTAVAAKAFDKMQADAAVLAGERDTVRNQYDTYQTQIQGWYAENDGKLKAMQNESISAKADAERYRGALLEAQKLGLIEVADNLLKPGTQTPPEKTNEEKFISRDDFMRAADTFADNLAGLEDMMWEHHKLFPNSAPLRATELRREAVAAGNKSVINYWEQKYKVPEARAAAAQVAKDSEIAKWKLEGAKEKETELVSRFGNPDTRPLTPSTSPFTRRPEAAGIRAKQPWDQPDGALSNDRVLRATQHLVKTQTN